MVTRLVRSFAVSKNKRRFTSQLSGDTIIDYFDPEVRHSRELGLDTEIDLGHGDLKKLGFPQRIKVVIYNID